MDGWIEFGQADLKILGLTVKMLFFLPFPDIFLFCEAVSRVCSI